jgi:hypothetical protein
VLDTSTSSQGASKASQKPVQNAMPMPVTFLMSDSAAKKNKVKSALHPEIKSPLLDTSNQLKNANQSHSKTYTKCIASASPISVCLSRLQKTKIR